MASILIKTLTGKEIRCPIDDLSTVLSVKQTLVTLEEGCPLERQKLIHQGQVLADSTLISALGIVSGQFMVLMVTKLPSAAPSNIPPAPMATTPAAVVLPPVPPAAVDPLLALRNHPLFPQLQATIHQNPEALGQMIQMLSQSNPELLEAINANEERFIEMMNEPSAFSPYDEDEDDDGGEYHDEHWGDDMDADEDEVQHDMDMLRMIVGMSPAEQAQFAATMGIPAERFNELLAMLQSMPASDLQDLLDGDAALPSELDPAMFSAEENASIGRIAGLGFTQREAMGAFVACDRNEEQAANFLLDGGHYDEDEGDYA